MTQDPAVDLLAPAVALQGAVLVAVGLGLLPLAAGLLGRLFPEPPPHPPRWGEPPTWGLGSVLLVGGAAVLGIGLSGLVLGALHHRELSAGADAAQVIGLEEELLAQALGMGLAVGTALFIARRGGGLGILGLRVGRSPRALVGGVAVYVLCAPLLLGTMELWPWLFTRLGGSYEPQGVVVDFAGMDRDGRLLAAILAVGVIPLIEELLFRGFLQPVLVRAMGAVPGIGATAVLFAWLHGASAFLPIAVLALILGSVQWRTGRLIAPFAIHALHNGLTVVAISLAPEWVAR